MKADGGAMTLRQKQSKFVWMVQNLIMFAFRHGYELTFGDAYRDPKYAKTRGKLGAKSFHCKRLAIDLNLFCDGKYLRGSEAHRQLGQYWESIGGTWGGRFRKSDGNHYSYGE